MPYLLNPVWPNCLQSMFLVDLRYLLCWWCGYSIIWWSWGKAYVLYCCWYPVLEIFCTQLFKLALFMGSLFVVPILLIILCVTSSPYWNSSVLTPLSLDLSCGQWRTDLLCCFSALTSHGVVLHSLKNLSQEGRQKALQTCGSHITVVVCFFVPCIFMYARPAKIFSIGKSLSMFYTVISPMLNPLIYSLRNSEIMNATKKLWTEKVRSSCKQVHYALQRK